MKKLVATTLFLYAHLCNCQHLVQSIYLIGDAGLPNPENIAYQELVSSKLDSSATNTFLFLGDNIYPSGLPDRDDPSRKVAEEILNAQINLVEQYRGSGYFIPGNHDWKRGRKIGWRYLQNQQQYIDSAKYDSIKLVPRNGCPGPELVMLGNSIAVIIIDSQWFLQKRGKPIGYTSTCKCKSKEQFEEVFRKMLEENKEHTLIVAAHHPILTYGEHGGVYPFMSHIFPLVDVQRWLYIPLPVVGSLYPLYRKLIGHIQDTQHRVNRNYRNMIMRNMKHYPGSLYVSGHEHALQHSMKDNVHYVVSGSSVKKAFVKKKGFAEYASHKIGFARIDQYSNGRVQLFFVEKESGLVAHEVEINK